MFNHVGSYRDYGDDISGNKAHVLMLYRMSVYQIYRGYTEEVIF